MNACIYLKLIWIFFKETNGLNVIFSSKRNSITIFDHNVKTKILPLFRDCKSFLLFPHIFFIILFHCIPFPLTAMAEAKRKEEGGRKKVFPLTLLPILYTLTCNSMYLTCISPFLAAMAEAKRKEEGGRKKVFPLTVLPILYILTFNSMYHTCISLFWQAWPKPNAKKKAKKKNQNSSEHSLTPPLTPYIK